MDVEDTLASFQGEEEWEALANKPAPKSHLLLYTLEQKEKSWKRLTLSLITYN
jgi:hypothetical protein